MEEKARRRREQTKKEVADKMKRFLNRTKAAAASKMDDTANNINAFNFKSLAELPTEQFQEIE
jgi:F0F1-type ATP synthase membrane subunit b/b'